LNLDIVSNFDIRISDLNVEELSILRWLYRYPEVVLQAGEEYAPNLICNFLYELAQRFNTFYAKHKILAENAESAKDAEIARFRLLLTEAVGQVLSNGLALLGIESLERM